MPGAPAHRFTALREALGGVSAKVLTETLQVVERDGLVSRWDFAESHPVSSTA